MTLQDNYFMYQKLDKHVSLDAIFDEDFTSPLSMPDLQFQGTIRLRSVKGFNYK